MNLLPMTLPHEVESVASSFECSMHSIRDQQIVGAQLRFVLQLVEGFEQQAVCFVQDEMLSSS